MNESIVSLRRKKFDKLVQLANDQPSDWLIDVLKYPVRPSIGRMPVLARLACLRILASRHSSGKPYVQRKKLIRFEFGI